MKTTIGNLEVIHTQLLIISDDSEEVWVRFMAFDWAVKLKFIFEKDEDSNQGQYKFIGEDDYGVFVLKNRNNELGMAFKAPVSFGNTNKKEVSLMACGYKIGHILKLDLQFCIGENTNDG